MQCLPLHGHLTWRMRVHHRPSIVNWCDACPSYMFCVWPVSQAWTSTCVLRAPAAPLALAEAQRAPRMMHCHDMQGGCELADETYRSAFGGLADIDEFCYFGTKLNLASIFAR